MRDEKIFSIQTEDRRRGGKRLLSRNEVSKAVGTNCICTITCCQKLDANRKEFALSYFLSISFIIVKLFHAFDILRNVNVFEN